METSQKRLKFKMKPDITIETVLSTLPPHEVREFIFGHLDFDELLEARMVSKLWQSLVDPLMEFHLVLSDDTKRNVKNFGSNRSIDSLSTLNFQGKYPSALNQLSHKVRMVRVSVKVLDEPLTFMNYRDQRKKNKGNGKLPLQHNCGISEYNFWRLVNDFSNVRKFQIASLAVKTFSKPKSLSRIYLPNMNELIVTFFDDGMQKLIPFLMNYFPNLKKVNVANIADTRKDRSNVYSWIFGFLARHHQTLEEVSLIFPEGMVKERRVNGQAILQPVRETQEDHKMPQQFYKLANSKLRTLQLKKLTWDISMKEGEVGRFNMGTTLLMAQTHLSSLQLDNLRRKDLKIWDKLGTLLEGLSKTLDTLILGGCFCEPMQDFEDDDDEEDGFSFFQCSWLKNCEKLKDLEVSICGVVVNSVEELPKESLRTLNLGYRLLQGQIEYIALNMKNLESWTLLQKSSMIDSLVPKVDLYIFETILYMPKLTSISLHSEAIDEKEIMKFVENEEGIHECQGSHRLDSARSGDLTFHVCRKKFIRDYSELQNRITSRRRSLPLPNNNDPIMARFLRNLAIGGEILVPQARNGIFLVID